MEEAIKFIPIDMCHVCMTPNSIEMYNNYNSSLNFVNKTDNYTQNAKSYAKFMRCKKCGAKFDIDWTQGQPRPLYFKPFYNIFINEYTRED